MKREALDLKKSLHQRPHRLYILCRRVTVKEPNGYAEETKRKEGRRCNEFDDAVLMCFLKKQSQLFPEEDVASNLEEAEAFLEECKWRL